VRSALGREVRRSALSHKQEMTLAPRFVMHGQTDSGWHGHGKINGTITVAATSGREQAASSPRSTHWRRPRSASPQLSAGNRRGRFGFDVVGFSQRGDVSQFRQNATSLEHLLASPGA
jgi:hypothetical protein